MTSMAARTTGSVTGSPTAPDLPATSTATIPAAERSTFSDFEGTVRRRAAARWSRHWLAYKRVAPLAFALALTAWVAVRNLGQAWDMHAYWFAAQNATPYAISTPSAPDAYLYSPAFLQLISPLAIFPWPVFATIWALILGAAFYALAREWAPLLLFVPFFASEFGSGNIHYLLALVLVFGLRRPGLWAFALLTKPTLGICLLWFVARREWRKLAEALLTTALVAGISALVAPALWGEWISLLLHAAAGPPAPASLLLLTWPLWLRLSIAAGITLFAARRDWPVLLPVAAVFALPVMWTLGASLLVACVPLGFRSPAAARVSPRPEDYWGYPPVIGPQDALGRDVPVHDRSQGVDGTGRARLGEEQPK